MQSPPSDVDGESANWVANWVATKFPAANWVATTFPAANWVRQNCPPGGPGLEVGGRVQSWEHSWPREASLENLLTPFSKYSLKAALEKVGEVLSANAGLINPHT